MASGPLELFSSIDSWLNDEAKILRHYVLRNRYKLSAVFLLDFLGGALFLPLKLLKKKAPAGHRRILLIRLDHIGDVLLSTAAAELIKKRYPDSRLSFLTSSAGAALLRNNPFVDEVLIFDAPWFSRRAKKGSWINLQELAGKIRRGKFELAVAPRGDLRENTAMFLASVPQRVGYGITGGGFLLTEQAVYSKTAHEVQRSLELLRMIGIRPDAFFKPAVYFTETEEKDYREQFEKLGLFGGGPSVGIQIEAGTTAKEWPEENIREFFRLADENLPETRVVLIGQERNRFRWVSGLSSRTRRLKIIDLIEKLDLRQLLWICSKQDYFIGPDSGPTHAAAWSGVPTLFLYSGTNIYEQWKCLAPSAFFLKKEVACAPCHSGQCRVKGHGCMAGITPIEVVQWLDGQLQNRVRV